MSLSSLTIRALDFNFIAKRPIFISRLRKLTLNPHSGMNWEMNDILKNAKIRNVNVKALLTYHKSKLVAWALFSKEDSKVTYSQTIKFRKDYGYLFQVYVSPDFRRQGVGSQLFNKAKKLAGNEAICICPWDDSSNRFYKKVAKGKKIIL